MRRSYAPAALSPTLPPLLPAYGRGFNPALGGGVPGDPVGLWLVKDGLEDSIGVSITLTMTTGTTADLMAATFSVPYEVPWIQADSDEGGDVFFDSGDGNAPIIRSGAVWYDMLNGSYVWIGLKGIAVYDTDMVAYQTKIQRYLGYYIPALYMEDALEMIDTLEMTA